MNRLVIFIAVLLLSLSPAEALNIRVLILDDVFQKIPPRDEPLEDMGQLRGDLLVNGIYYAGNIQVLKGKESLYLINELPFEEYIKHVVNAEVGTNWDMEALKVQAVISRTYALYHKKKNGFRGAYDLTSSVLHQVYKGSSFDARISYAVMQTEGEVLTYDGNLIEAFYHSTSGGRTEDSGEVFGNSLPYLKSLDSGSETSPYWIWERRIPADEIEKALGTNTVTGIRIKTYTATQRVKTIDIIQDGEILNIEAKDLRKILGWSRIPSTNFTVRQENGDYIFEGKGYGHGVGLCQWSALEMSRKGMSYRQILAYFYPGTKIGNYEDL